MIAPNEHTGGKSTARNGAATNDGDFKALVNLLSVYSETENELAALQAAANSEYLLTVDAIKSKYARHQEDLIRIENELEAISRRHPEWFQEKKTLKTPYGTVALKENPPKIVADHPEVSIALIEAEGERDETFHAEHFLHRSTELNLEALAGMTDEQLKKFRLKRDQSDTFTVKPAKLDLGKAVKDSADKKEAK